MPLPPWLIKAISAQLENVPLHGLREAYAALSKDYGVSFTATPAASGDARVRLAGDVAPASGLEDRWLAYLAARMPATYEAVSFALRQIPDKALEGCTAVLDLGAGPGTACWAAQERLPGLSRLSLLDQEAYPLKLAEVLAQYRPPEQAPRLMHRKGDLSGDLGGFDPHHLVLMTYALNELSSQKVEGVLEAAWAATAKTLLIVEPGTPAGFDRLLQARAFLINKEASLVAPCPQMGPCPLRADSSKKWCHFSVRLERRSLHKAIKGGDLGYEDEKFCFLAATRLDVKAAPARLMGWPRRENRHIKLELCKADGSLGTEFLARKSTPAHLRQAARRARWGEAWDPAKVPVNIDDSDDGDDV